MPRFLIRKLEQLDSLSSEDRAVLEAAARRRVVELEGGEEIAAEGDRPGPIRLFLDGWAYRYKSFEDGRRQILGCLLPGDLFDLNVPLLHAMDHSAATATPVVLGEIAAEELQELAGRSPALARALSWDAAVQAAIQREWTLSVGRRTALERVAHLLCEIFERLAAIGLTEAESCDLPLNQAQVADATGLSVVHVNRILQQLRSLGLLRLHGRRMELPDRPALERLALFDRGYLHVGRHRAQPRA